MMNATKRRSLLLSLRYRRAQLVYVLSGVHPDSAAAQAAREELEDVVAELRDMGVYND